MTNLAFNQFSGLYKARLQSLGSLQVSDEQGKALHGILHFRKSMAVIRMRCANAFSHIPMCFLDVYLL